MDEVKARIVTEYCGRARFRVVVMVDGRQEEDLPAWRDTVVKVRNQAYERWLSAADEIEVRDSAPLGHVKGTRMETETREIDLTPDFKGIFQQMMREAQAQAVAWQNNLTGRDQPVDVQMAENLRAIQRWFWPLAMAANAMPSVVEVEQFRTLMAEILADINKGWRRSSKPRSTRARRTTNDQEKA